MAPNSGRIDIAKLRERATITISCEPEDMPIEGNTLASGDAREDRKAELWIKRELARGNEWAWCTVVVRATYAEREGRDVLGCCSYKSKADFRKPGGYYDDMVSEALADLARNLEGTLAQCEQIREVCA